MRRVLMCAAWLWAGSCSAAAPDAFPQVASAYLVKVGDAVLWEKSAHKRLPPASLTKIMTVLLALERSDLQTLVTVSAAAAAETGSKLGLRAGDQLRVADLVAATLLGSANDACHALADHVAGDEARFVVLMNKRVIELGLRDTHFTNACGHDHSQHYASAYDLIRLTELALHNKVFAAIVAQPDLKISLANRSRTFQLQNSNALIGRLRGAAGVKTGYTRRAGKCLIALAQRGKVRVLLLMLNAPDRWWDADEMLNRAFVHVAPAS